jgi:hypothetical protein
VAITFVDSAEGGNATSGVISIPKADISGLADNDFLLASFGKVDDDGTLTVPTGWTLADVQSSSTGDDQKNAYAYKYVTSAAGEPTNWDFGSGVTDLKGIVVTCWRGVDSTTPIEVVETTSLGTSSVNPDPVDTTTLTNDAVVVTMVTLVANTVVATFVGGAPSGFTLAGDFQIDNGTTEFFTAVAYKTQATAGAVTVPVWTNTPTGGTPEWSVRTLVLKPAAVSGAFTLSCDPGPFTVTGAAAALVGPTPDIVYSRPLIRGSANPILTNDVGTYDEIKTGPSKLVKVGEGDYRLWYEGVENINSPDFPTLPCYATSPDGSVWTKYAGNPIMDGAVAWENDEASPTSVLWDPDAGLWKMWYHGGNNSTDSRRIGYATSFDGLTWTKYAGNPVLLPGAGGAWDDFEVADCKVARVSSTDYRMLYRGWTSADVAKIGLATSSDGISWTKSGSNPVLDWGAGGAWDDSRIIACTTPLLINGVWHLWYIASDAPSGGTDSVGYASSTDWVTWTKGSSNPVLLDATGENITDSIDAWVDTDERVRIMYGQYDLGASPVLRGKGEAITSMAARAFDGSDDRIDLDGETDFDFERTDAFTLAAWIYPTLLNQNGGIIAKQLQGAGFTGWHMGLSSGALAFVLESSGAGLFQRLETTDATLNAWQSVVTTYDGSQVIGGIGLYRNGAAATTTDPNNNLTGTILNNVNAQIGSRGGTSTPGFWYTGRIAYAAVWNVELTATEIAQYHAGGVMPRQDALVAFLRFDQGANPEEDDTGGNDGTATGTTVVDGPPVVYDPLGAQPGSVTVSGQSTSLAVARMVNAAPGSFTLSGVDAGLVHVTSGAFSLNSEPGSYSVTGSDATAARGLFVTADPGAHAVTGVAADLVLATPGVYVLDAGTGSYSVAGAAASSIAARLFTASPGAYAVAGTAAGLELARTVNAVPASYALTGVNTTFFRTGVMSADAGVYSVAGADATFQVAGRPPNLDEILTGWIAGASGGGRIRQVITGGVE